MGAFFIDMVNVGGRPTKYRPEMCDELDKYLETTGKEQMSLPTVQGFSLWLGVNADTLNEWRKIHPKFSVTLGRLKELQAQQLIDDGIYGGKEVNATIVKLMLQNNHGMRERRETELTGNIFELNINGQEDRHNKRPSKVSTETARSD